jgi:GntR family transcriptional regulator, transcriptional repressor for pyruvate dehydrogenase complex
MATESSSESSPRTPSQSQRVVEGLLERIQHRQLVPGARIPTEPELMKEFGVSRSVVREAVSRLQANGVLRTRQGVGSFVLSPRPTVDLAIEAPEELKVRQKLAMLELRLSLEADAAALAAQRRSAEQLAAMETALTEFERRQEAGESTTEADFHFHELIAEATGNEYFVLVLRSLGKATIPRTLSRRRVPAKARRFGEVTAALKANKDVTLQEHREVLNAIRSSDPTHARAAMYLHLCKSIARLKAASG